MNLRIADKAPLRGFGTTDIAQRNNYLFQMTEEYQDFKEFLCYKLNMDADDLNEMYDEFIKWSNGEITTEQITAL